LQAIVEIAGSVSPTLQKAVSSTCDKLDNINIKAAAVGAAAAAGAVAVGKAAIEASKYLVDLGSQFDNATDAIRIVTGATGEALDGLMADFDAVYSSVPTTMDDAGKAIADYNTRLGLTGEELQGVSTQAIQVADMLGEDLGGVIETSSKAFQQWNIDANDMGGAMDYVFKASQSTGVGFSELMTTVQSVGPQLQEMGYSFEEATALVGQLEKAGVNTSEVLSAMKKSTAGFAKDGISASQGLQKYVDAITNAKDMTKATQIATEVFGTKAAPTMAAAIRDGSLSVADLTKSLQESGETINGCATDTYDYAEQMQIFKQKAQVALEPLAGTMFNSLNELMPVVSELMESLIPVIQDLSTTLTPLIEDLVAEIGPMLSQLVPPVMKIVSAVAQKLIPPLVQIITSVLPVLIQLAEMIMPIIVFIADEILPAIVSIIQALLPPIMSLISAVLPVVLELLQAIMPVISMLVSSILPIVVDLINQLVPIITMVTSAVVPLISVILSLITSVLQPLMPLIQFIADLFAHSLGAAISGIMPVINALTGVFSGLISFIQNIFAGNWSAAWAGIVQIFRSIWDGVVAIFKAPINWIIDGINFFIGSLNKLKIPDWVPVVGGKGIDIPLIPKLATGGFTDGVSIAGEAGMEAVISFDPAYHAENVGYWEKAGRLLGVLDDTGANAGANNTTQLSQAGKLMELDDFSLGQLTETTIIYYDFSGFSYAPKVDAGAATNKEDIVAALKEHESEFFDWLEGWLRQKEVGNYDRVSIY
jgi:phage-related minor tail protein